MFCPKCGTKNPDDGKFCRTCGVDLGNVSAALNGPKAPLYGVGGLDAGTAQIQSESRRRKDPAEVYGDSIKSIISGVGFLIVAIVLLTTNVANGQKWWWAMLFPAFTFLAKGISDLLKSRKMEALRPQFHSTTANMVESATVVNSLPSTKADYISPDSSYTTGDLVPPSVTDNTTRHLEISSEGETMTLPKK